MQLVVTMSVFVGRLRSLAVLLIVVIAGACAGAPTATSTGRPSAPESPSPSPTLTTLAPSPSPSVEASCANQTFARLTEAQRIGQLFNVGLDNDRLGAASYVDAFFENLDWDVVNGWIATYSLSS